MSKKSPFSESLSEIFADAEDEVAWYRQYCEIVRAPGHGGGFFVRRKQDATVAEEEET